MNRELGQHVDRALQDREFALDFYNGKYTEENLRIKYPDRYQRRRILDLYRKFLGDALRPLLTEVRTSEIQNRIAKEVGIKNYPEIKRRLEAGENVNDLISEHNLQALLAILEEDTAKRQREAHDLVVDQVNSEKKGLEDEVFEKAEEYFQVEEEKYFDKLTGLSSLEGLERVFLREMSDIKSYDDDEIFAFVSFDVDSFKKINNLLTHDGADEVLKELARRLSETLRSSDHVGRRSGDEFVILARTKKNGVDDLIMKVKSTLEEPFKVIVNGEEKEVTVSLTGGIYLIDKSNSSDVDYKHCSIKSEEAASYGKTHQKGDFIVYSADLMADLDKLDEKGIEDYFKDVVYRELSREFEDLEVRMKGVSPENEPEKFSLLKLKQLSLENKLEASLQDRVAEYYLAKLERSSKK